MSNHSDISTHDLSNLPPFSNFGQTRFGVIFFTPLLKKTRIDFLTLFLDCRKPTEEAVGYQLAQSAVALMRGQAVRRAILALAHDLHMGYSQEIRLPGAR